MPMLDFEIRGKFVRRRGHSEIHNWKSEICNYFEFVKKGAEVYAKA